MPLNEPFGGVPGEPYEGDPPEFNIPGDLRYKKYRPPPFSKYVEPVMPWLRDMRGLAREGVVDEAGETMFNPTREQWRYMKQDAKQLRHEEIIRQKRLEREQEKRMENWGPTIGDPPPISSELWMDQADQFGIPRT